MFRSAYLAAGKQTLLRASPETSLLRHDMISSSAPHKGSPPTPWLAFPHERGEEVGKNPNPSAGSLMVGNGRLLFYERRNSRLNPVLLRRAPPAEPQLLAISTQRYKERTSYRSHTLLLSAAFCTFKWSSGASQEAGWQTLSIVTVFYPNI